MRKITLVFLILISIFLSSCGVTQEEQTKQTEDIKLEDQEISKNNNTVRVEGLTLNKEIEFDNDILYVFKEIN